MNPCETAAELLPESWHDRLNTPERAADRLWLHEHLESCDACAALAKLWRQMGELPAPSPDPGARARFDRMLAAYEAGAAGEGAGRPRAPRRWWSWAVLPMPAWAAVLLLVGAGSGWVGRGALAPAPPNKEIADLRQQVQATQQLAVLSLLQQQSASDRLQGVSYGAGLSGSDPRVTAALLHSLNYDTSPDVRLAALDALQRSAAVPEVQRSLLDSFRYQKSPLVQIALVDSFVETRDARARALLQHVSGDAAYNPEVRQRAAWGLAQPAWN